MERDIIARQQALGRSMNDTDTVLSGSKHPFADSNERFRLLVEGVRDYAIYMLDTDGRIISWNTGAESVKGYSKSEVIGQHFSLFFTPEDVKRGKPTTIMQIAAREG